MHRQLQTVLIAVTMVPIMTMGQSIPGGLRDFVSSYERVWNTHDADAVATFFAEDADMIIGAGSRVEGRAAIADSWRTYFDHIDEDRIGMFTIESARLISPQAAIINIDSTTSARRPEDQPELPTRLARPESAGPNNLLRLGIATPSQLRHWPRDCHRRCTVSLARR